MATPIKDLMGDFIPSTFMSQEMYITHMTFKYRIDSWLLITKVMLRDRTKRVAFTSGKTPAHALQAMYQGVITKTLTWKDDTPYQRPIDKPKGKV